MSQKKREGGGRHRDRVRRREGGRGPRQKSGEGERSHTAGRDDAKSGEPAPSPADPTRLGFGLANYAVFAAALASIVGGYVLLDQGSVTGAPILLILGYAVLLPTGLILGWRRLG